MIKQITKTLLLIIILSLAVSGTGCSVISDISSLRCSSEATNNNDLGAAFTSGNALLAVLGWEIPNKRILPPATGEQNMYVEVVIANQGNYSATFNTKQHVWLEDSDKNHYEAQLTWPNVSRLDGEMVPNEKVQVRLGFRAPLTACGLKVFVDISPLGGNILGVPLGSQPKMVDLPNAFKKITPPKFSPVGQRVWVNNVGITANILPSPKMSQFLGSGKVDMSVVDIKIENFNKQDILIDTENQFYVIDSTGHRYLADTQLTESIGSKMLIGTLQPRYVATAMIAFRTPYKVGGVNLVFDPDPHQPNGKVFITLGEPPS
jgi:hypothetical protein